MASDLFDELLAYVLFNLSEHVAEFYRYGSAPEVSLPRRYGEAT